MNFTVDIRRLMMLYYTETIPCHVRRTRVGIEIPLIEHVSFAAFVAAAATATATGTSPPYSAVASQLPLDGTLPLSEYCIFLFFFNIYNYVLN